MPARVTAGEYGGKPPLLMVAALLAAASALAGCASATGDFGRPQPDPLVSLKSRLATTRESVERFVGLDALSGDIALVDAQHHSRPSRQRGDGLTLVELELRRRHWHFHQPLGAWRETSATARLNAIADRAAEDETLLAELLALAPDLAEKQRIRRGAARMFGRASPQLVADALASQAENERLWQQICIGATGRARWLRRELERQVIAAPEPQAVNAERSLRRLEQRIRQGCSSESSLRAHPPESEPQAPASPPDAAAPLPLAPPAAGLVVKG